MIYAARVNRATARFILRSGSAASKGSSATPPSTRHFLIAGDKILKTGLTPSVPSPDAFLIANIGPTLAPAPLCTHHSSLITPHCLTPFLFDTNKPHKIIILVSVPMKTKEKPLSIRYKFALRRIGQPAADGNLVNRPTGRFILRTGSAGSKGSPTR